MLTSKPARLFLFVYTLLLHGLVFLVLYKLSHAEGCKRDMAEACLMQSVGTSGGPGPAVWAPH